MTVKELIEELRYFPEDMEVEFAYPYGDYWHSVVCGKIKNVDKGFVEYSAYHRSDKLIEPDEDDEEYDEDTDTSDRKEVVILQ